MTNTKQLGIWMDHASAHVMEFINDPLTTNTIETKITQDKEHSAGKSEHVTHNKEQHQQADYYKHLGEIIRNYDEVILFGPTTAKTELLNYLRLDHNFAKIRIDIKQTDKMSENQEHAFVKDHFSKH